MLTKKFSFNKTAMVAGLLALLSTSEIFAKDCCDKNRDRNRDRSISVVEAAQAIYQDTSTVAPAVGDPIPFTVNNFTTNVRVNSSGTVFEIEVPGLYSIDAALATTVPALGDAVSGYITINGRELLTFFGTNANTLSLTGELRFPNRLIYLKRGDQVSVVLSAFSAGTTVGTRAFNLVALNNSRVTRH